MLKIYNNPNNQSKTLHFLHGNSITPQSYSKLLNSLSNRYLVKYFLLRSLWYKEKMPNFKNWKIFLDDYLDSIKNEDNIVGVGHSIGGNLLLKAALKKPEKFTKIILLDPTFLIPFKIRIWNMFSFFNLQSIFLPLIKSAKNKKIYYNSVDDIYLSYRKKKIFSNFSNSDLKILIESIIIENEDGVKLIYPSDWDSKIYKTSMCNDMFIWNNISNLDVKITIIRAKASNVFFSDAEKLLAKNNNKIEFQTIEGDHFFPINNAEKTIKLIENYI
jgi:pimeloyl-ACP methyl ester carboxylesterase